MPTPAQEHGKDVFSGLTPEQPRRFIYNDPNQYAGYFKNTGANGKTIHAEKSGSGDQFRLNDNEMYVGVPTTLTSLLLTGAQKLYVGSNLASAASVTVPPEGNVFNVTGTATITSLTARLAGHMLILIFAGDAKVRGGGNITLIGGPYNARAGSTLTLISNTDTTWLEIARSGDRPTGCYLTKSADQIQNFTSAAAVTWASAPVNNGPSWASGNPTRYAPGVAGRHHCEGTIFESGGDIWTIWLAINGTNQITLNKDRDEALSGKGMVFAQEFVLASSSDYAEIIAHSDNSTGTQLESESNASFRLIEAY